MATKDYSSIYTIQEFFLQEIAPKYFHMEDVSLNNVGLYGMITDIIGTTTEDSFNVTDRYINEMLPAKAELVDFIYSHAASYGVTDILAKPSVMPFVLFVKESDVIGNGSWESNAHRFEIDAGTTIIVDGMNYSIPNDIVILSTYFRGSYTHRAFYQKKFHNSLYTNTNPYIRLFKTIVDKEFWIGLRIDVYQYLRTPSDNPIITNSILNIPYVNIDYNNQLCNFEVLYKPYGKDTYIQLEKRMETQVPVTTPFVYYKLIDDHTIRISFANDDRYFVPGYNSTLRVYTYETVGKAGNFKYTEDTDISVVASDESEELAYNRGIIFFGVMKNDSIGGRDQLTQEEIKRLYLEKMVSISSFTTDTDLNMHYLSFAEIYKNNALFVKYRDDYAGREYGCFTRLTDGTDIYPTNTLNLKLDTAMVDSHFPSLRQYIVKPGRRYCYADDDTRDLIIPMGEDSVSQDIEYTTFALMVITVRPNSVHYYMNSVNKTVDLDYTYMNTTSVLNFLAGECSIKRNAIIGENVYTVDLEITRVDGVTEIVGENDEKNPFEMKLDNLKVLMIFNTGDMHYATMEPVSVSNDRNTLTFRARLKTDDMIDNEGISILNLTRGTSGIQEERVLQMYNTDVRFCIFYKYEEDTLTMGHEYTNIGMLEGYSLCNEYRPLEGEFYFAYPLTLVRSHVMFEEDFSSTDGWHLIIKQIPLFGRDFLLKLDDTTDVLNSIISQHTFLMDSMREIAANFTITIKFYNTYGRSRLFYIGNDENGEKILLNKVHSELYLKIKFFDGITIENYLPNVKIFIKKYLESLNMTKNGSNHLHMSVLIQQLHNEFDCIELIIIEGFNGYGPEVQSIKLDSLLVKSIDPNTVPEYLTIKESDIHITTITN